MRIRKIDAVSNFDTNVNDGMIEIYVGIELTLELVNQQTISIVLDRDDDYAWKHNSELDNDENEFMSVWVSDHLEDIVRQASEQYDRSINGCNMRDYEEEFNIEELDFETDSITDDKTNVERLPGYSQVCIWPGIIVENGKELEEAILKEMDVRIQFLETIKTAPDVDDRGNVVEETGDRSDVFFAVHNEDVGKFAIPKLRIGARWIEDVLSSVNGYNKNPLYPSRVFEYKTW